MQEGLPQKEFAKTKHHKEELLCQREQWFTTLSTRHYRTGSFFSFFLRRASFSKPPSLASVTSVFAFPPWLTLPHPEAEPRPGQWKHCPCLIGALLKNTVLSSTHAFTYLVCVLATFPSSMCWPQGKYKILLHTCSFGIYTVDSHGI